jgi:integrase
LGRTTRQNKITSPELVAQVNPKNIRLMEDFLEYLRSVGKAESTVNAYHSDLLIFFVWALQHADNKYFPEISKRDIVAYQNWLLRSNENSAARVRRLKSTLSSLSNYIEAILDDELPQFRSIVRKIENPVNEPAREKTVLSDEQADELLDYLMKQEFYEKACCFALARWSGRRKSELVRFKASYFTPENIIYGSLYKTPEKIRTKGRGVNGKMLTCYVLAKPFQPYLDKWMEQREKLGIESEWLFPDKKDPTKPLPISTLNSWAETFSRILGIPIYWHSLRHFFTTSLSKANLPDSVIKTIVGWESLEMVELYKDIDADEEIGKYFEGGEIVAPKQAGLSDL